jgi:4-amino-4-deoxy-L-arabinose transferase-like glycosyltransferase
MNRKTRRFSLSAGAALFAGLLLRLWFIRHLPLIAGDSLVYGDIARNILQHGVYGFTQPGRTPGTTQIVPTLIRLPGYPFFLAVCFRLFGIENYYAVLYVQAAADLITCALAGALAKVLFGCRAGLVAFWLAALCPFTASYVAEPLTETLVLTSIALALYAFARWQIAGRGYSLWLWITALTLVSSVLLRPEQILFAAAILFAMLWNSLRNRSPSQPRLRAASPVLCAALVIVLPFIVWTIRNARTLHVFQPFAPRYANDPGELAPLGFARWYRTWAIDFTDTENVYWNYSGDPIALSDLPPRAFNAGSPAASQSLRDRTTQLLADYNATSLSTAAVSPTIDARFNALGIERIHEHPFPYYFSLPIARVLNMTLRPRVEMMPIPLEWWTWRQHRAQAAFATAYGALNLAYILLGLAGLSAWRRYRWRATTNAAAPPDNFREFGLAMAASILLRAALLLTIDNSEPRYTLEFFPILFVWAAAFFAPLLRRNASANEAGDNERWHFAQDSSPSSVAPTQANPRS